MSREWARRRPRELSVRLALLVAASLSAAVLASYAYFTVFQGRIMQWLVGDVAVEHDEVLESMERAPGEVLRDELGRRIVSESEWERTFAHFDRIVGLTLLAAALLTSAAVGWAVSHIVTRRLRALADAVREPILPGGPLPGPFKPGPPDEIGVLATALNEMRERIQELVAALAERDFERRRWVALVSHDLRNPLQALTACVDRAAVEARRIKDDDRRASMLDLLATARHDVDRFEVLTLDLLDIARLDAEDALNLEPVPPGELARAAAKGLRVLAQNQGRSLDVEVGPRSPELLADGRRVLRALENLLRNAIQHARSHVVLRVTRTDDGVVAAGVRFAVEDDGGGLPTEADGRVDVARLGAYKSRDDSAGLGLVVARRVAETHGGRIGAHNRPEGGACVWIEVPTRPPGCVAVEAPEDEEE